MTGGWVGALGVGLPALTLFATLGAILSRPDAELIAMGSHPEAQERRSSVRVADPAPLDDFDAWLACGRYDDEVTRGVELARARRVVLKELIRSDPEEALARAIPYSVRRELPRPVVSLLEAPVSRTVDLDVELACGGPGGRSWRRCWAEVDGVRLQAFTHGERAGVLTKRRLSVHGIAIDGVLAVHDDPLRELSADEVTDRGLAGRIVQLGGRLFAVESDAALEVARRRLRAAEAMPGPDALPAYRDLALGGMEGIFPLAMQDGEGDVEGDLPPVAFSPWTEGAKTMLYIRARFADEDPGYEPVSLANAQTQQGEAEVFWEENSYGKSTLTTTYTTVVTLPKNGGAYVGDFNSLHVDARAAARAANATWNHNNFDFYTVVTNSATNNQGNGFGYSGVALLGGRASHLLRNFISVRTASHEFGHNLGLFHSGYWLTDSPSPGGADSKPGGYAGDAADDERIEYGHKFAVMGSQVGAGDFNGGRAHYAVSDKHRLDWLSASNGEVVSTSSGGTFRLHRQDVRRSQLTAITAGVPRAIKINVPATDPSGFSQPYKYWLGYRLLPTNGIAQNWLPHGLQVDWSRDGGGFRGAVQLDMTPYSRDSGPYGNNPGPDSDNSDKEDSVLLLGRTFSDPGADIHFTPVASGGTSPNEWLDVVVNVGTQALNAPPVIQSFGVSSTHPAPGELVNFSVNATDPDGDPLAYHWDMDDNTVQSGQLNKATRGKIWNSAGHYVVRIEVSDMKGGKTTASEVIRVGDPADSGVIRGRVTHAGRPVEGAYIRAGGVDTWSDSDGSYALAGLSVGSFTVKADKAGLTFSRRFSNPVQTGSFGIDFTANEPWTGGGGTVAMVSPYRIEVPLGLATSFSAQAFDGSGNPVAFSPAWSVSGGGVIGGDGVFQARALGGPFEVTAQSGGVAATAEVTVVADGGVGAADGIWTNAAGGSWPVDGNWSGGTVAGGTDFTADFGTLDIATDATVTLDANLAIGHLVFGDTGTGSAAGWTLESGSGGSLTMAVTMPTITVNPLGPGKFARITAPLDGTHGFTKAGAGNLLLNHSGNPISGPIVLSGGNLQLNSQALSSATTVAINAGALVIATTGADAVGGTISFGGGILQFNQNPGTDYSARFSTAANQPYRISVVSGREVTFGSNLASAGGTLVKSMEGALVLASANSYSGGTDLAGGSLKYDNASALGSGEVSFTADATLQAGVAAQLANAVSVGEGIAGTLDTNNHATTLEGALTGAGTLIKTGAGVLTLGGGPGNNLAGGIDVSAGRLDVIDGLSLSNTTGPITVAAGAAFNYSKNFLNGSDLALALNLSGSGEGSFGALNLRGNVTATGPITLAADATISHDFNNATISGPIVGPDRNLTLATTQSAQPGLVVSGPIQLGTGGIRVDAAGGTNTVTLSGNNAYRGETHLETGTLRLTGSSRIDDASSVRIEAGAVLHLDFAGTDDVGALHLGGVEMPDGTYGSISSGAENQSIHFEGTGILRVGAAGDGYDSWAASQVPPVTGGENGDDDSDGVLNLIEYALVDGGERGVLHGSTISFSKRGVPYGSDLTYVIEVSDSLQADSWAPAVTHGPAELGQPISYNLAPAPGIPVKFARLRVGRTP